MPYDKQGVFTAKRKTYQGKIVPVVQKAVRNYVKKQVDRMAETKCVTTVAGFADLEAASQRIIHLSAIGQGDGPKDRVGQVIAPVRIQGRIVVKSTATHPIAWVRCMLIKAKQCDGTPPTLADILPQSATSISALPYDMPFVEELGAATSYGLPQAKRKYEIMYDKLRYLANATDDSSHLAVRFNLNKKLSGKTLFIDTTTSGEGNNTYFLFIHTDAGDDKVEEAHDIRFFFKDA